MPYKIFHHKSNSSPNSKYGSRIFVVVEEVRKYTFTVTILTRSISSFQEYEELKDFRKMYIAYKTRFIFLQHYFQHFLPTFSTLRTD